MSKLEQTNKLLKQELALAVNREVGLPEALITITYVDCSPDYKYARIGFSVLPDHLVGTALKKLRSASSVLSASLRKRTRLRRLPHFNWVFDATEKEASVLEDFISKLPD